MKDTFISLYLSFFFFLFSFFFFERPDDRGNIHWEQINNWLWNFEPVSRFLSFKLSFLASQFQELFPIGNWASDEKSFEIGLNSWSNESQGILRLMRNESIGAIHLAIDIWNSCQHFCLALFCFVVAVVAVFCYVWVFSIPTFYFAPAIVAAFIWFELEIRFDDSISTEKWFIHESV